MFSIFRQDLARMFPPPATLRTCFIAFFEMAVWAVGIFRFGKWAQTIRFWPVRKLFMLLYFVLNKMSETISGIRISVESEIGPGLVIHNFGGVIIRGRLGADCTIVQGAQLISRADGKSAGWPTLGDGVYVGSGAKILGNITVGNRVRIGANAVVSCDIPAGCVVLAPEPRVLADPSESAAPSHTGSSVPVHRVATAGFARKLVLETLQLPAGYALADDASLEDLPVWDSLNYLRLVTAIEGQLGRRLDLDETASLATLADVERLLNPVVSELEQ